MSAKEKCHADEPEQVKILFKTTAIGDGDQNPYWPNATKKEKEMLETI